MNNAAALAEIPAPGRPADSGNRSSRTKEAKAPRRTAGVRTRSSLKERYFLADGKGDSVVSLGRELGSENDAIVAAFQEQNSFFVITEFRVAAQFTGKGPELVKEGVIRTEKS